MVFDWQIDRLTENGDLGGPDSGMWGRFPAAFLGSETQVRPNDGINNKMQPDLHLACLHAARPKSRVLGTAQPPQYGKRKAFA